MLLSFIINQNYELKLHWNLHGIFLSEPEFLIPTNKIMSLFNELGYPVSSSPFYFPLYQCSTDVQIFPKSIFYKQTFFSYVAQTFSQRTMTTSHCLITAISWFFSFAAENLQNIEVIMITFLLSRIVPESQLPTNHCFNLCQIFKKQLQQTEFADTWHWTDSGS